jgi:aminopeptidase N
MARGVARRRLYQLSRPTGFDSHGRGSSWADLEAYLFSSWDVDRWSQPVSMISERYRDFDTYNLMIYNKGAMFFRQLRYVVGPDVMRRILRTYYARWRLKHVDEAAFRAVAEEVSHMDLGWLFGQWLHATPPIDYRLDKVQRRRLPDGDG